MNVFEALDRACAEVGIVPPRSYAEGKWTKADTLSGKNGKGDGRIMVGGWYVVAFNHQKGSHATIKLKDGELTVAERAQIQRDMKAAQAERVREARRAAAVAAEIVSASRPSIHPYLVEKGFPSEQSLVIHVDVLVPILERNHKKVPSLVTPHGRSAIVVPARRGGTITTVQLIWEDGTKRFLSGGALSGASHRIAKGRDTWTVEGLATGLSLRLALRGLHRADTVLVCFSAGNVAAIASDYIATDNDKPIADYGGIGTGEYHAKKTGRPYVMPPILGQDFNDLHRERGIFEVQRVLGAFLREART